MVKRKHQVGAGEPRRPKRQCRVKQAEPELPQYHNDERWTLDEKKAFLAVLKLHGEDVNQIQKFLPGRSKSNITQAITRYKNYARKKYEQRRRMRAPIEFWNYQAEFLTENVHDISTVLARVMSIAAHLEAHKQPVGKDDPDYSDIYEYISDVLKGDEPRRLGCTEARIMLSLFHDMANYLHSLDFLKQGKLMLKKFHALTECIDLSNVQSSHASFLNIMKTLQEDLTDETSDKADSSGKQKINQPTTSGANKKTPKRTQSSSSQSGDGSQPSTSQSQDLSESSTSQSGECSHSTSSQSEQQAPSTSNQSEQQVQTTPSQSEEQAEASTSQSGSQTDKDTIEEELVPQHKPLYSLNPFCIPVKYLQPSHRYTQCFISTSKPIPRQQQQLQQIAKPEIFIKQALEKGLIKPGDQIRVKVVQDKDNKNKVILTKKSTT